LAGPRPEPQRAWRAACPNCGAPVEFRSAASTSAVCGFCRSTLARDGDTLRRTGASAELFDDHSPLQLGVDGLLQGERFTLVGRLQLAYAGGTWNEWHALFDSGRSGWLSEDNGAYVVGFESPLRGTVPPVEELLPGARARVDGRSWDVASAVQARLLAAQGELPRSPRVDGREFLVVELRNPHGEVASLEFGDAGSTPLLSIGRSVALADLALKGLREDSAKTLGARSLNCPQCGAAVEVRLASTQSLSCAQCHSLIDLSAVGGDAAAAFAQQPAQPPGGRLPRIALGTTGRLAADGAAPLDWQVVGYLVRTDVPEDAEDEPSPWSEYLLYNRKAGFAFLVDAADGWSVVRPLTGAPEVRGRQATWQADRYAQGYTYPAVVTWVEGEFYWRVERGARAVVTDYAGQGKAVRRLLSREAAAGEVTWSAGRRLDAAEVQAAFPTLVRAGRSLPADVGPLAAAAGQDWGRLGLFAVIALVLVVTSMMARCGDDDCGEVARHFGNDSNEYRQCVQSRATGSSRGGGSFGGYSTGGGHK
jgi:hypothetical protein